MFRNDNVCKHRSTLFASHTALGRRRSTRFSVSGIQRARGHTLRILSFLTHLPVKKGTVYEKRFIYINEDGSNESQHHTVLSVC